MDIIINKKIEEKEAEIKDLTKTIKDNADIKMKILLHKELLEVYKQLTELIKQFTIECSKQSQGKQP